MGETEGSHILGLLQIIQSFSFIVDLNRKREESITTTQQKHAFAWHRQQCKSMMIIEMKLNLPALVDFVECLK